MLPAEHRIRRSREFATAVRHGRRCGGRTVVVHLAVTDGEEPPRIGFVVSRAVGGAVVRNKVRRRLRHLAREWIPRLAPGSLLVVRALPAAATASYETLRADLERGVRTVLASRHRDGRRSRAAT